MSSKRICVRCACGMDCNARYTWAILWIPGGPGRGADGDTWLDCCRLNPKNRPVQTSKTVSSVGTPNILRDRRRPPHRPATGLSASRENKRGYRRSTALYGGSAGPAILLRPLCRYSTNCWRVNGKAPCTRPADALRGCSHSGAGVGRRDCERLAAAVQIWAAKRCRTLRPAGLKSSHKRHHHRPLAWNSSSTPIWTFIFANFSSSCLPP